MAAIQISDQNKFSYFWSTSHLDTSYQVLSQLAFWFRIAKQISKIVAMIATILAIFYLQVTLMLPTKFRVNWPFSSGEELKNIFKMAAMVAILDFQSEGF